MSAYTEKGSKEVSPIRFTFSRFTMVVLLSISVALCLVTIGVLVAFVALLRKEAARLRSLKTAYRNEMESIREAGESWAFLSTLGIAVRQYSDALCELSLARSTGKESEEQRQEVSVTEDALVERIHGLIAFAAVPLSVPAAADAAEKIVRECLRHRKALVIDLDRRMSRLRAKVDSASVGRRTTHTFA